MKQKKEKKKEGGTFHQLILLQWMEKISSVRMA
jgi:hypothetical protein